MKLNQTKENAGGRLVNFRPLFYGFLAFALGIGLSYYLFSLNWIYIIIVCVGFGLCLGLAIWRKLFVNFLVIVACFCGGIGCYFIESNNFTSNITNGQVYEVVGRVGTKIYPQEKSTYLILEDVTFNGYKAGNLSLGIYDATGALQVETGQVYKFSSEIYDEFLFENNQFNSYAYKMNASHNAFVNFSQIEIVSIGNISFAESIRLSVKNLLHTFMPYETAELSYSILFGDQTQLDENIKQSFSTSGLGHLVAVSGLNIAVLVACLYWLLRLFKTPKIAKFCIMAVVLLFYCYLCSFAPSVVRASLMAIVFLASGLLARQYDLLSSLGVAGFIILIFNPFSVFDAGFLMSFVSVIAIGVLAPVIGRFVSQKLRLSKTLSDALSIDICTTLAISPILALYFQEISFFSWLTNFICVPLFSFAYIMVFVLVFVVGIFKFLGFLLFIPNIVLQFIIWFSSVISSWHFAIITLYSLSLVGVVAFYLSIFFMGKLYMKNFVQKLVASSLCVISSIVMVLVTDVPFVPQTCTYTQLNSSSPAAVVTAENGEVLVVSNGRSEFVDEYLMNKRIERVSTFVCYEPESENSTAFALKYNAKSIIYSASSLETFGSFRIEFIYQNENLKAIYLNINDVGVLFAVDRIGSNQAENIRRHIEGYEIDALFQDRNTKNFLAVNNFDYVFSQDKISGVINNYATKICGTFAFSISSGIIGEIRSEN